MQVAWMRGEGNTQLTHHEHGLNGLNGSKCPEEQRCYAPTLLLLPDYTDE